MAQSSGSAVSRKVKPAKPYPEFPLFPHAVGLWAKKVRGKLHYFGPWADPNAALQKWLDQQDDLRAGRTPREKRDGLTIADLCNRYLSAKQGLLQSGELGPRTFASYKASTDKLVEFFGKRRIVNDIAPEDFEQFRRSLAEGRSPVSLRGDVLNVRMVFGYGFENSLIERPRYGQAFKIPHRSVLKRHRQQQTNQHGKRMFEADELRKIIGAAPQPMKAMILLGINCGFGATDLANLPQSAVDLDKGWVDFPRVKTAVERRCPLWPETIVAVREAIENRKDPRDPADSGLVFLTRCGQRWVRVSATGPVDAVACEMTKLLNDLGLKRKRVGFYALRHTLQTVGGGARDQVALNLIFGHSDGTQAEAYREDIDDSRLKAVTDHVRSWLFPAKKKPR